MQTLWKGEVLLQGLSDAHSDLHVRVIVSVHPGKIVEHVGGEQIMRVALIGCDIIEKPEDVVVIQGASWLSRPIRVRPCGEEEQRRQLLPAVRAATQAAPSLRSIVVVDGAPKLLRLTANKYRLVLELTEVVVTGLSSVSSVTSSASSSSSSGGSGSGSEVAATPALKYRVVHPVTASDSTEHAPLGLVHYKIKDGALIGSGPSKEAKKAAAKASKGKGKSKDKAAEKEKAGEGSSPSAAVSADAPAADQQAVRLIGVRKMHRTPLWKWQGFSTDMCFRPFDVSTDLAPMTAAAAAAATATASTVAEAEADGTVPLVDLAQLTSALGDAVAFLKGTWAPARPVVVPALPPLPAAATAAAVAPPAASAPAPAAAPPAAAPAAASTAAPPAAASTSPAVSTEPTADSTAAAAADSSGPEAEAATATASATEEAAVEPTATSS